MTGESVVLPWCRGSVWTTCTASIPHVATSPFTTPVAGYQVCVVTAYGSDGTALGSLTVTDPACEAENISALDRKTICVHSAFMHVYFNFMHCCTTLNLC